MTDVVTIINVNKMCWNSFLCHSQSLMYYVCVCVCSYCKEAFFLSSSRNDKKNPRDCVIIMFRKTMTTAAVRWYLNVISKDNFNLWQRFVYTTGRIRCAILSELRWNSAIWVVSNENQLTFGDNNKNVLIAYIWQSSMCFMLRLQALRIFN